MTSASALIEDVARYLSDFEEDESYVHWSREDLLSYFRLAVNIVATTKKDLFTKRTEIPLVEGSVQEVPTSCKSDITVIGQADENGVIKERPRKLLLNMYPVLGRPICKSKVKPSESNKIEYKMKGYDYITEDHRQIQVEPPVPAGFEGSLVLTCYSPPDVSAPDAEVDLQGSEPAIFELMLYYAWGVDIEDTATRERSNTHWQNAMTLLNLDAQAQQIARGMRNG